MRVLRRLSRRGNAVSLLTLGGCSLSVDGVVVAGVPANFYRVAVYLLLSAKHHSVTRQRLRGLLWPDLDGESAGANLRQALARIRQVQSSHGFELIQSNFSSVFLSDKATVEWDLMHLLQALGKPTQIFLPSCRLYGGDLLAELPQSSGEFEDWLGHEREMLRNRFVDKMSEAMDGTDSPPQEALCLCSRHLLSIDPCNEQAYRIMMIDAAHKGDLRRVQMLYAACERHLRADFDVAVSDVTRKLWQDLTRRLSSEATSRAADPR